MQQVSTYYKVINSKCYKITHTTTAADDATFHMVYVDYKNKEVLRCDVMVLVSEYVAITTNDCDVMLTIFRKTIKPSIQMLVHIKQQIVSYHTNKHIQQDN